MIHTEQLEDGKKRAKAVIEYAFDSVVGTVTGIPAGRNYTLRRVVQL